MVSKIKLLGIIPLLLFISSSFVYGQGGVVVIEGKYNSTTFVPVAVDASGNLILSGGATTNPAASATGSAVPSSADYQGLNVSGTLRGQTGTNTSGSIYAADVNITGSPAVTYNSTQPTLTNGQTEADLQITSRGALIVQPGTEVFFTTPTPSTTGGWSSLNATAADGATACTNSAQVIKASQGTFGGYFINNPNTADSWLHIYNVAAGSVTVGTTNPALTFRIPGTASNSVGANLEITNGVQFSTAMSMACTTTAGGNGAPSNSLEADIFFK